MKQDLLLLHGALGDSTLFEPLLPLLSPHFKLHRINFNGHGTAPLADGFSIAHFSQQLMRYIDDQKLVKPLVFGYSMGGYVALQLLVDHPESLGQLLTLGTKLYWTPESAEREVKLLDPETILHKVPKFAEVLAQRHQAIGWRQNMLLTAQMMLSLGNGDAFTLDQLRSIETPVVICLGEKDTMVGQEESQEAVDYLPNARFKVVSEWPHPLEKIAPASLAQLITEAF